MKDCNEKIDCSGRREFLVKAAFLAGGVVLTLSGAASAIGTPFEDVVVPIDEKSPLNKVGGSITVDSTAGKIVILRTGEVIFVAVSAICTHKGGPLEYNPAIKMFECAWHGSKFGTDGSNASGPAKTPVRSFPATGTATTVTVKVGS